MGLQKSKCIGKKVRVSGWGNYPVVEAEVYPSYDKEIICQLIESGFKGISYGNGKSYGDSALASKILDLRPQDRFLSFDHENGRLRCQAGLTLNTILRIIVPKGWFLPVTPGTKYVTVGGAVASDVHGKNHHLHGTFSEFVNELLILTGRGEFLICSRSLNVDLFYATCGGMGLTGVILEVELRLQHIDSAFITEKTIKCSNLESTLENLERHDRWTYSVVWIDCLTNGNRVGRSVISVGEFRKEGPLYASENRKWGVPFNAPDLFLNKATVSIFNSAYFHKLSKSVIQRVVHYDSFFYPLDNVAHWNRIYGKRGFVQYQFVIPIDKGRRNLEEILHFITKLKWCLTLAKMTFLLKHTCVYTFSLIWVIFC